MYQRISSWYIESVVPIAGTVEAYPIAGNGLGRPPAGAEIHAAVETNSLLTLWSHLRVGPWSSVVPHTFLLLPNDGLAGIPLIEPNASHLIGLVASDRDPLPPVAHALLNVAGRLDVASTIDRQVGQLSPAAIC